MSVRTTIFWVRAFSFRNPILGSFRGSFGYCGSLMNIANAAHVRHGYGDPPPYYQMEARLFSSRSECADIIVALEEGYKDHTKSSSFGKNLTKFVRLWASHRKSVVWQFHVCSRTWRVAFVRSFPTIQLKIRFSSL